MSAYRNHVAFPFKWHVPLRAATNGATAIEFALIAPILFLFIIGIVELSLILISMSILEGATNIAARTGKTGVSTGYIRADFSDYVKYEIGVLSAGLLDPNQANVTVTSLNSFDDMTYASNTDTPNLEPCAAGFSSPCDQPGQFIDANGDGRRDSLGTTGAGSSGQAVLYTVTYPWVLFTPMMAQFFGNVFQISAIAAVKNEPFSQ